ncbi:MAG TPA: VanW family protein [Kofleriaceae bacterium]|jgi:vancomycin resistance protein YoaR|nr:VanW family protein [Kofleriaceae bacterium]
MFQSRSHPQGTVLLGIAGGMFVVSSGLVAGYFILGTKSEARAATTAVHEPAPMAAPRADRAAPAPGSLGSSDVSPALAGYLQHEVELVAAHGSAKLTWAQLGATIDPDEVGAAAASATPSDLAALAAKGSLPLRLDRDKVTAALRAIKAAHDSSPLNAYLDLEERKIYDDKPGLGLDVWASLPRLEAAARQAAAKVELVNVAVPAPVTKQTLGIDDISTVLGHHLTKFPVTDRDRNFNLKLAASKLNGAVLPPSEEWSFNQQVGERSEKEGYKIAHVITAGEMVDGLAGGTCQISTTLFGAAFFAGLDIVKTTNHSRPSAYTPLGFDATVVWPNTDLKLKNPYEFPVVIHYRVANGEALVEILGKARPYDKVVFERHVVESTPFESEERLDNDMPKDLTSIDQAGFNGYKLERFRKFFKDGKLVKTNKWIVEYKPVTEFIRRGTNTDPDAKDPPEKPVGHLQEPKGDDFTMAE